MAKNELTPEEIELYELDEEGKAYLEYNDKVGGKPLGMIVPFGYPKGVEEMGGVIAVYKECIKQGKTWEDLLGYESPKGDAIE
ncbi:hypothetical protein [Paenibacillus lentus]|uniref:Uncharacterized protein n=1 Tax=Paenibacillus lentus TaxID=1338368 RepID=A0A3S8RPR7_9BACL|nr:hypothetical protein [Paenibacillus lentus]AZK44783.1 hypothetical protein EIM92_00045 [Paenibacillus lentus]